MKEKNDELSTLINLQKKEIQGNNKFIIELKKEALTSLAVFSDTLVACGESSIYLFDLKTNSKINFFYSMY